MSDTAASPASTVPEGAAPRPRRGQATRHRHGGSPPPAGPVRRAITFAHRWLGLTLGLVLLVIGLTGSILVFKREIDALLNPALFTPAASTNTLSYADVMRIAGDINHAPLGAIRPPDSVWPVWVVSPPRGPRAPEAPPDTLYIDPSNGALLGQRDASTSFIAIVDRLHQTLLLTDWIGFRTAREVVGWFGVALIAFSISGIYLWWPRGMRFWPATISFRARPAVRRDLDIHKLAGFWTSVFMLVLAVSGDAIIFPQWFRPLLGISAPANGGPGGPPGAPQAARGDAPRGDNPRGEGGRGEGMMAREGGANGMGAGMSAGMGAGPRGEAGPRADGAGRGEGVARADGAPRPEGAPRGGEGDAEGTRPPRAPHVVGNPDAVVAAALAQVPHTLVTTLIPPTGGRPVWSVQMREEGTSTELRARIMVTVDGRTNTVVEERSPRTRSTAEDILAMQRWLHGGTLLNWPGRILACITGLALFGLGVTGWLVWLGKRRNKRRLRNQRAAALAASRAAAPAE